MMKEQINSMIVMHDEMNDLFRLGYRMDCSDVDISLRSLPVYLIDIFTKNKWIKEDQSIDYHVAYPYLVKTEDNDTSFNARAYLRDFVFPCESDYFPPFDWHFHMPNPHAPDRAISWSKLINWVIFCRIAFDITREKHAQNAGVSLDVMNMFERGDDNISLKDFKSILKSMGMVMKD